MFFNPDDFSVAFNSVEGKYLVSSLWDSKVKLPDGSWVDSDVSNAEFFEPRGNWGFVSENEEKALIKEFLSKFPPP